MEEYKNDQKAKRDDMNKQIKSQKEEITMKQKLINAKNEQLRETEFTYEQQLQQLTNDYDAEQKKKNELDDELTKVKTDLVECETSFPKEIKDLKKRIADSKKSTEEYEEKTRQLADELKQLKAQQASTK